MDFCISKKSDLNPIMSIIGEAQVYLASQGIDQWQDGYPNENTVLEDISNSESYNVKNNNGVMLGTTMLSTRKEPTYNFIDGNWLTAKNAKYGVIHRMAVGRSYRNSGIAEFILKKCEQKLINNKVESMRIDTHEKNIGMQSLLKKMEYKYCGIIFLEDGDKRLAFEKILIK